MVVAVSAAVAVEPLMPRAPLQPPDAVHEAALVEVQLSVDEPPLTRFDGFAPSVTVGAGGGVVTRAIAVYGPVLPAASRARTR